MKKGCLIAMVVTVVVVLIVGLGMYSFIKNHYNNMVTLEENVTQKWAQVENVYQRRADLIPNLVEVVKGYASHERETLEAVVNARSKVGGQINLGPEMLNNPEAFAQFQQSQGALTSALQRLMVVVERYPELKADQRFADLQVQLEGTENRIDVERRKFNGLVRSFNTAIRKFPASLISGMTARSKMAYFESITEGAEEAPAVEF